MSDEQPISRVEFTSLVERVERGEKRLETCEGDRVAIRGDVAKLTESITTLHAKIDGQNVILDRLDKFATGLFADPKARLLVQAVVAAALAWLVSKGHPLP